MKKVRLFAITVLSILTVAIVTASTGFAAETLMESLGFAVGGGLTVASLPIWFKMVDSVKTFMKLSEEEIGKLTSEERAMYYKASMENIEKTVEGLVEQMKDAENDTEKAENLAEQLKGYKQMFETLKQTQINQGEIITSIKNSNGEDVTPKTFEGIVKAAWDNATKDDAIDKALASKTGIQVEINKAEQTYGDINAGSDFAQMRQGVIDQPVRAPKIRSIFPTTPVSTEFYKYVEQNTVVRDAQNVAKCAEVVSTTKETLVVNSIETKVVKDMIDFCRLFVADYPFMRSRIDRLINQSLALRIDSQLLLGDGVGENLNSIDSYSSEFSAANVACVLTASIQAANMVDLILGMQTQIIELGQQEAYDPNVVIVNKCDWFKNVESLKDLDNNYLDSRVTMIGGTPFIGGMMVMWTPIVAQNTCYVFDAMKGEIIDRQMVEIDVAFENKDNWEKEIATLKGLERLNFLVPTNWQNAFMKCTDIGAAITAIDKP
jgi:hypothetical protein